MTESNFNETIYLSMNEDVRLGVERGYFRSGLEHYELHGKREGRKLVRFDPNSHSIQDYTRLVRTLIDSHSDNLDLAMAKAVGSNTLESFRDFGDRQYHVLCRFGLQNGQAIYDLACGSGRTASALLRHSWHGEYRGADIIPDLVNYATLCNPGFRFFVHPDYSIHADNDSQDMIYSWSLFTHLQIEETFLYAKDCYRALKPGGVFIFSFLTLQEPSHRQIFLNHVTELEYGQPRVHLDAFLDQGTIITLFTLMLNFKHLTFIEANNPSTTPIGSFGQALAVFTK